MNKLHDSMKLKVLLGYFILVTIASLAVWFIYSQFLLYDDNKLQINRLNSKILYFNAMLTDLYQAESLERTYIQTENPEAYRNYQKAMDSIFSRIDTLSALAKNPKEKMHTDSIRSLLGRKQKSVKELIALKRNDASDDIYAKAISKLAESGDSLNFLFNISKTVTEKKDTTYIQVKKKKFLQRLMYAFKPPEGGDSLIQVSNSQAVKTDTLTKSFNAADSLAGFLTSLIKDIQSEDEVLERQLTQKEKEALANDRILTLQLRQMLSMFEKEIIVNSLDDISNLQERNRLTANYLITLGIFAVLIVAVFLFLILKDISKSQKYRSALEQAKSYSDSLLKSKEQLMVSIAHDIKTPITSVLGYARLMKETNDPGQKRYFFDNINKSADHMLKLINDLTDLTKLQTGKIKAEYTEFSLGELVNDVFTEFYPIAMAKNLVFTISNAVQEEKQYRNDPLRLKQILSNVVSNAIKYTESGSVHLSVIVEKSDDNTDKIRFDITDTGIGISEENKESIFQEFAQVNFPGRESYEGAGLGLTITKRLVSLLNGSIDVSSKPGEGSTFSVRISFEKAGIIPSAVKNSKINPEIERNDFRKILIIDDDEVFLNMICDSLKKRRMEVIPCNHPYHAMKIIENECIDLIISDFRLPVISAVDFLSYIQKKTGRLIPVIIMSGQEMNQKESFQGLLISSFIKKPFPLEELTGRIDQALGNKSPLKEKKLPDEKSESLDTFENYSLDQIRQFAMDDPQGVRRILVSFVESSFENLAEFEKCIRNMNRTGLSELAHKMLAMFRQLEAEEIVEMLMEIEGRNNSGELSDEEWKDLGKYTLQRISQFITVICEDQSLLLRENIKH